MYEIIGANVVDGKILVRRTSDLKLVYIDVVTSDQDPGPSQQENSIPIQSLPNLNSNNSELENSIPQRPQPVEISQINEATAGETSEGKAEWTDNTTKLLIPLYRNMRKKVGKSQELKSKTKMWQKLTSEINKIGYVYTVKQVENKWTSLERAYRKTSDHNKKTGASRKTCAYFTELDEILKERDSISPRYILGVEEVENEQVISSEQLVEEEEMDDLSLTNATSNSTSSALGTSDNSKNGREILSWKL